jgi:hypothetical protein
MGSHPVPLTPKTIFASLAATGDNDVALEESSGEIE